MGISWFTAVDMAYILIGGLLHALIASSTARDVSQLRFARLLASQYLPLQGAANPGFYTSTHSGVRCELSLKQRGSELTFLSHGKTGRSHVIGFFKVGTTGGTLTVKMAFWYRTQLKDYSWLHPLRASAIVLWLWRIAHGDAHPTTIVHDDIENEETIEMLDAIGADSDRTFNLEGSSVEEVMRCNSEDMHTAHVGVDLQAVARYFSDCPNGKMTRRICEEIGARLSRLHVFYPPHHDGRLSRNRPTVVLDLEPCSASTHQTAEPPFAVLSRIGENGDVSSSAG